MQKEKKVKLLIITQKVDQNDDVLGFFHGWIAEFSKHVEQVTVIALGVGKYHLPNNVRVFSLGKEKQRNLLQKLFTFYFLLFTLRKEYDAVFVHMNQEYVLLGGLPWKLLGKKITMWRNHYAGSFLTDIVAFFCDKIFCTSKFSYTAKYKKTILMPVGIDTDKFIKSESLNVHKVKNSILFLGRISPSKKPEMLIRALASLAREHTDFTAIFVGSPLPVDEAYYHSLQELTQSFGLAERVAFKPSISNTETPDIYGSHTIFVNTSPSGMYDKTIFEAMACESIILTSNLNLKGEIEDIFLFAEDDANDLAEKLKVLLLLGAEKQEKYGKMLRKYVVEKQSLSLLAHALKNNL